jgi:hypothetical protein
VGPTVHLTGEGSCTVTAGQAGNANYNAAASVPRSFTINPAIVSDDFTIAATLPSVTVTTGQAATEHITITPNPATLTALTLACSGLPSKATCAFAPIQVPAGSTLTDVLVTISTASAATSSLERPRMPFAGWLGFISAGLLGMVVVGVSKKNRKRTRMLHAMAMMVLLTVSGCGTHTQQTIPGTPPGTSTVIVTGSTTGATHSTTFTLIVN